MARIFVHQPNGMIHIEDGATVAVYDTVAEFLGDEASYALPAGIAALNYEDHGARRHFTLRLADGSTRPGVTDAMADPNDNALAAQLDGYIDSVATYAAAKKLRTLPFSREALVPVAAAAILPLVLAGSTRLPFAELWKIAKKLLLL